MKTDIETLATALYVKIDDELVTDRWCGRPPLLSDAERVCLAVAAAIWRNHRTGQAVSRSLTAYDHEELLV